MRKRIRFVAALALLALLTSAYAPGMMSAEPEPTPVGQDLRTRRGYSYGAISEEHAISVAYFLFDNGILMVYEDDEGMGELLEVDLSASPDPNAAAENLVFEDMDGDGYNDLKIPVAPGQWKTWRWNSEEWAFENGPTNDEDEYEGEWLSDSHSNTLRIDRTDIHHRMPKSASTSSYKKTPEGLRVTDYKKDYWIRKTADGGLVMEGVTGVFYRKGSAKSGGYAEKTAPYLGIWRNLDTGATVQIKPGQYIRAGKNGISVGVHDVDDSGRIVLFDHVGHIDADGRLCFDDLGVFMRLDDAK